MGGLSVEVEGWMFICYEEKLWLKGFNLYHLPDKRLNDENSETFPPYYGKLPELRQKC
jgi:hypothetical protein